MIFQAHTYARHDTTSPPSPPPPSGTLAQVDDMLAQAQSVSRNLLEQRRIFGSVQDKLVTVGERFPVINGLLNAVRRKKSKVCVCVCPECSCKLHGGA